MPRSPSPPTAFPFMSGDFDFPHASSGSQYPQLTLAPPEPNGRDQGERDASATAPHQSLTSQRRPWVEPRRRQLRRSLLQTEREPRDVSALSRRPQLPPANARPHATPSERYLRRSHARLREYRNAMDSASELLDSLGDPTFRAPSPVVNAHTRTRSPPGDLDGPRRQTKRRKLGHASSGSASYDGFKYGYKGQVVPGRLKMEVVSCDGGEYEKYSGHGNYKIQNVLKTDKSVYCSENPRCNLLLKHIGQASFTLEKVVIKAPDRGFDAPVQEGLIFVDMSSEDLLAGTSGYKITYDESARQSPTPSSGSHGDQPLSLQEAIEDPYIWENSRQGMQEAMEEQIERLRLRSRRLRVGSSTQPGQERRRGEPRSPNRQEDTAEHCEYPTNESYATAGISAPTPPPFTITTESDDDTDESEEATAPAIMADRLRRESRWRADSDDEDDLTYRLPQVRPAYALGDTYGERRWRTERFLDPIRAQRLRAPSRIEPKNDLPDSEILINPHARFFIAKHKNKITIRFHPPISGKFVLLKLWSPTHDGNIDIESVQFYGYSGPRFFPSVQLC
ncbi:hypothetical protein BDV96DRAFT_613031 [Lophiotrema nucula]|uniref:Uncharacterized protein n=1 Tax=Lophiotrema nucula TaxID=690887 RepID=A0A6A5Z7N9_9PLEO|nr:hypothetical protein BDV96DRAFT_613031 [Lophiotrema nucula]